MNESKIPPNANITMIVKGRKKIIYIYKRERETERKRLILLVELRGLQGTNRGLRVLSNSSAS